MALIWSVTGWFALLHKVLPTKHQRIGFGILAAMILIGMSVFGITHISQYLAYFHGEKGQEETVTIWLGDVITAEDYVFASVTYEPAYWFYFDQYQLPEHTILYRTEKEWGSAYLVVDDRENDSYEELLLNQKLVTMEDCPQNRVQKIYEYGHYTVFQCDAIQP